MLFTQMKLQYNKKTTNLYGFFLFKTWQHWTAMFDLFFSFAARSRLHSTGTAQVSDSEDKLG